MDAVNTTGVRPGRRCSRLICLGGRQEGGAREIWKEKEIGKGRHTSKHIMAENRT